MKYILTNYLFGAETAVKHIGFELLTPEATDENGVVTEATYSDVKVYDTNITLPTIEEGDEAYYVNVNLWIKEENDLIPPFQKLLPIVSLNSMTGFEVDEQREEFVTNFMASLNV